MKEEKKDERTFAALYVKSSYKKKEKKKKKKEREQSESKNRTHK